MIMLSLCMIVKNGGNTLERCLNTIRDHVDEIVIVDTGSSDSTKEIAARFGAKIFDFTHETHPQHFYLDDESSEGPAPYTYQWQLADFAAARQFSFDQATHPWRMWLDADDEVKGPHLIKPFLETVTPEKAVVATYQIGEKVFMKRTRVVHKENNGIKWGGAVHEDMLGQTQVVMAPDKFFILHCQEEGRKIVTGRNFKIIHREVKLIEAAGGKLTPRQVFYYAQETATWKLDAAIKLYEHYLRISDWGEEKYVARMRLGNYHEAAGDIFRACEHYATAALVDCPHLPDAWMALGRVEHNRQNWSLCVDNIMKGISLGNPERILLADQLEINLRPYWYLNYALAQLNRIEEAKDACMTGLAYDPADDKLLNNLKLYETHLTKKSAQIAKTIKTLQVAKDRTLKKKRR